MSCCSEMLSSCSTYRRWILYIYSFLCVSLVAGLVYGWPALRQQLLEEDGSELSEKTLGAIFTVGAWSTQGGRFFVGLARDRFGTQRTVGVCFVAVILGVVGIGLSDANDAVALAISLFAVGLGSGVQLCTQPVAGLFPKRAGTILSSLSGAFQISGLVFLALTKGFSSLSRQTSFLGFAIFLVFLGVGALLLFPKGGSFVLVEEQEKTKDENIGVVEEAEETEIATEAFSKMSSSMLGSEQRQIKDEDCVPSKGDFQAKTTENLDYHPSDADEEERGQRDTTGNGKSSEVAASTGGDDNIVKDNPDQTNTDAKKEPTAMEQLKCLEYIFLCTWFSVNLVPLQYYVGSIGFQLEQKGDDDGFYTDLFAIIYAAAALVAPAGGYMSDKAGLGVTQGLATALVAASLFILASERIPLPGQSVGLACYGIGRMLVFGMFFSNAGKRFGYKNFGTLAGLGLLISALVSLLQYPLIAAAADGKAATVNIACGVVLFCMAPYFVWLHRQETDSRVARVAT